MDKTTVQELMQTGLVIIDKPPGPTSHEVSSWVKKILKTKKSGHSGTLDPNVTGVLPVALNRATKLLQFLTKDKKRYVGILKFRKSQNVEKIEKALKLFEGEILQLPPKKCAVKRIQRKKKIYGLNILEIKENRVLFETEVEAGTYIRSIARELNYMFGYCVLEELRRIGVGKITDNYSIKLQDLVDAFWLYETQKDSSKLERIIHPIQDFIDFPKIIISDNTIEPITHGSPLFRPGVEKYDNFERGELIAIFTKNNEFLGVHQAIEKSDNLKNIGSGIISIPKKVFKNPKDLNAPVV
ncbi:RNA-guided pseudouridylation complex pseudouridine synthase subunit Cbf5 [Candidatus Micrarchaeota archaeon]|nr:RNA-guided pseudouridylation complex pseudouridine synthase subunit Cbf5 [Candidatus Micrarchaeota archaeon]